MLCFVVLVSLNVLCSREAFVFPAVVSVRNVKMIMNTRLYQMYLCFVFCVCVFTVSSWSLWAGWHKFMRGQTSRPHSMMSC